MTNDQPLMPVALPGSVPAAADERRGLPSASGMERLCLCPGSWQAEQQCNPEPESADAAMGTRLHACMEEGSMPEDPDEADALEWCREMERELSQELLGGEESPAVAREERLYDAKGQFSGKPDALCTAGGKALIFDYKFGRGEVAAATGNMQLATLAVLAGQAHPQAEEIFACILQPFASRALPQIVRYTRQDLQAAEKYIREAIAKAQNPQAMLCPGMKQCKYCRAQAVCPAALREALTCQAVDRWESLALEARAGLWKRAQQARKLADAIERHIKADLKAEVEIPGLELAPGRTSFTITDANAAYSILAAEYNISAEEFTTCCKVGITALDKLVHAKRKEQDPKAKTKDSAAALRELLAPCAESKTTEGSIRETKTAVQA